MRDDVLPIWAGWCLWGLRVVVGLCGCDWIRAGWGGEERGVKEGVVSERSPYLHG